jgi:hypothetical protein
LKEPQPQRPSMPPLHGPDDGWCFPTFAPLRRHSLGFLVRWDRATND